MLLGISLIPVLSLQLLPSSRSNDLSVSFSWDNAGPELLEMEVTTKLEGALARTRGNCFGDREWLGNNQAFYR